MGNGEMGKAKGETAKWTVTVATCHERVGYGQSCSLSTGYRVLEGLCLFSRQFCDFALKMVNFGTFWLALLICNSTVYASRDSHLQ